MLIEADGITKYYGSLRAMDNITLEVKEGEIFGIFGPNADTTVLGTKLPYDMKDAMSHAAKNFNDFKDKLNKWSPRFGFLWDISQRGEWLVRGAAGIYHNLVPAGVFGELVTQDGSINTRSGVGTLDSWPDAPGLGAARWARSSVFQGFRRLPTLASLPRGLT